MENEKKLDFEMHGQRRCSQGTDVICEWKIFMLYIWLNYNSWPKGTCVYSTLMHCLINFQPKYIQLLDSCAFFTQLATSYGGTEYRI